VFVFEKLFWSCLLPVKPKEHPKEWLIHYGRLSSLANIRLGGKGLPETNTLAYFATHQLKKIRTLSPNLELKNHFFYFFRNLEFKNWFWCKGKFNFDEFENRPFIDFFFGLISRFWTEAQNKESQIWLYSVRWLL
jgi:hypothetical protein